MKSTYQRDYELDDLFWYYDEMGGGVEGKRNKIIGASAVAGKHYRPCVVTTGVWGGVRGGGGGRGLLVCLLARSLA